MNYKARILFFIVFSFGFISILPIFGEGGGGLECPTDGGAYTLIGGQSQFRSEDYENGLLTVGIVTCPYSTQQQGLQEFAEIQAIFLIGGTLNEQWISDYECSASIAEQENQFFHTSETHFASVVFSVIELNQTSQNILASLEGPSVARPCAVPDLTGIPISSGGGGGDDFIPEPVITSASAATLSLNPDSGLLETNLRDNASPKRINPSETLSLRFNLHQDAGINLIEHVSIHFSQNEVQPSVFEADDTFIRYQKGKPLEVNDPNGLFKFADFAIIPQDSYNSVFQFILEFSGPTDSYDIFLWAWDLDKNAVREKFTNAIKVSDSFIPNWIKNNAGWWASDQISDDDFANGIQFLIQEGIIIVPPTSDVTEGPNQIPDWVKNNAGWWAEDLISETEFVNALQFLISIGVISIS